MIDQQIHRIILVTPTLKVHQRIKKSLGAAFEVMHAADADAARAYSATTVPAVLLIEVRKTDDSLNELRELAAFVQPFGIPLVALVVDRDDAPVEWVEKLTRAGADDCIAQNTPAHLMQLRLRNLGALAAARQAETHYTSLVNNTTDAVIVVGTDGRIRSWNAGAEAIYGWSAADVLNQNVETILGPQRFLEPQNGIEPQQQVMEAGIWQGIVVQRHRSGHDLVIRSSVVSMRNRAGQFSGLLGINRDISDAYKAQQELTRTEARRYQTFWNAPVMLCNVDGDGKIIEINKMWLQASGFAQENLIGQPLRNFLRPADGTTDLDTIHAAGQLPGHDIDFQLRCQSGAWLDVLLDASLQTDETEPRLLVCVRDTSLIREMESAFMMAQQQLSSVIEALPGIVFVFDREGVYRKILTPHNALLMRPASELLGRSFTEIMPDHYSRLLLAAIRAALDHNTPQTVIYRLEINNREHWFEGFFRRLDDQQAVAVVTDVTHRQYAQDAERRQRRLAEALRETAAAFSQTLRLEDVLRTILTMVQRVVPAETANIMLIERGVARIVGHRGFEEVGFRPEEIDAVSFIVRETPTFQQISEAQKPLIVNDTHDSVKVEWKENGLTRWIRSWLSAPIILDGKVAGFINLDSNQVGRFTPEDATNLQAFADQASIALRNAQLYEEARQQNRDMRQRVAERTAELSALNVALRQRMQEKARTEKALEEERNLLRTLIDSLPDHIYVKDPEGRVVLMNAGGTRFLGLSDPESLREKTDEAWLPPEAAARRREEEQQLLATGKPIHNQELDMADHRGHVHRLLVSKFPLRDAEGNITGLVGVNRDITELREVEERLNIVLSGARCLLWLADVEAVMKTGNGGSHAEANPGYSFTLRVANEAAARELLPLNTPDGNYSGAWEQSILPEDAQRRQDILHTQLTQGQSSFNHEIRCITADGSTHWLMEDVTIRSQAPGRWTLLGVCTDISARKLAEQELQDAYGQLERRVNQRTNELVVANRELKQEIAERRRAEEAERQQRFLADALRDGITALNQNLDRDDILDRLLDAVRQVVPHDAANISMVMVQSNTMQPVRMRGYPDNETLDAIPIDHYAEVPDLLMKPQPFHIRDTRDYPGWSELPAFKWVRSHIKVPIMHSEQIIGFLALDSAQTDNFTDDHLRWLQAFANQAGIAIRNSQLMSEIRRHAEILENKVTDRTVELAAEQARMRAILDSMREGVIFEDADRRVQYVNQALTDITGHEAVHWFNAAYSDRLRSMLRLQDGRDWRGDDTDEPMTLDQERERFFRQILRSIDRRSFWEGEVSLERADGDERDVYMVCTAVTDSEGQRVGQLTVLRDISQSKRLEEQKARFIASASHELRTPIANLKTRLYLLKRQPERTSEHLEVAQKAANWLQDLVTDMFDMTRFERGVLPFEREEVIVQELLREVLDYQQPEAERRSVALRLRAPEEPIIFSTDPYRLTQVVSNLLVNAINYTSHDGSVTIHLDAEPERLILTVEDTGEGIAPEALPHLFKPFYRARNDGQGVGLGLAIVQEIVRLHQGTIEVKSELGRGSRFIVTLPRSPGSD